MKVIGVAESGEEALEFVKKTIPDVITMDIVLPQMDGFEATQRILQSSAFPIRIIIVSAHFKHDDLTKSFKAIAAGAIDILEKPVGPRDPNFQAMADALIQSIKNAASIKSLPAVTAPPNRTGKIPNFEGLKLLSRTRAVAMGASLGGPKTLNVILSHLPAHFPAPILLVQHISEGFVQGFVNWLSQDATVTIKIAEHQEPVQAGTVYVAPDQCHLLAGPGQTVLLSDAPPVRGLRPSVSALFRSMAQEYGAAGVGIILSGMGHDGADELLLMKKSGSLTIAQDEQSCLVFGMPKEAIAIGAVDYVLSPPQIADLLTSMAHGNLPI